MGQYCRVQCTGVKSRQLGRRAIVTYAAIAVRPIRRSTRGNGRPARKVGVPFYFGTHYLARHMLKTSARGHIVVCAWRTVRASASIC